MAENPYQSPQRATEAVDSTRQRPIEVTLLVVVASGYAINSLILYFYGLAPLNLDEGGLPWAHSDLESLVAKGAVSSMLGFICAVGLWRGSRWAWWLTGSLGAAGVVSAFHSLVAPLYLPEELAPRDLKGALAYGLNSFLFTMYSVLIAYLMKPEVRTYFRLSELNRGKAVGTFAIVGVALALLAEAARWFWWYHPAG